MTTRNDDSLPIKRGPGAPRGNTNALKHGFYSRRMRPIDTADAENYEFTRLKEEIAVLRIFIRRIVELSNSVEDIEVMIPLLRVLNISVTSLSRLIRTEKIVWPGQTREEFDEEILAALNQLQAARAYWQQTDDEITPTDDLSSDHLPIVPD